MISKKNSVIVAALALLAAGTGGVVMAHVGPHGSNPGHTVIAKGEVHKGSVYTANERVTIDGTVDGDLYCVGRTVRIAGVVTGDVICGAQTISVSGSVEGSVRVAGQTVSIDGKTDRAATVFGQTVSVGQDAAVGMDLNGAAQAIDMSGLVAGGMVMGGQSVTVGGQVDGNVDVGVERLTVQDGAKVGGSVVYYSEKDADIASGVVAGSITKQVPEDAKNASVQQSTEAMHYISAMVFAANLVIVALALALVAPRFVYTATDVSGGRAALAALTGGGLLVVTPVVAVMVMATVAGAMLGAGLLLGWLGLMMLSGPFAAFYVGRLLVGKRTTNVLVTMLAGAAVMTVLYLVPLAPINILTAMFAGILGSGLLVMRLAQRFPRPVYNLPVAKRK